MSNGSIRMSPGDNFPVAKLSLEMKATRDHVVHAIMLNQNFFRDKMVECVKKSFDEFDFQREVNRAFNEFVSEAVQEAIKEYFCSGNGCKILDRAIDQAVKSSFKKAGEE